MTCQDIFSVFHNLISFSCFGFLLMSPSHERPFPIPSRNFAPRCKESLEPVLRIAPAGDELTEVTRMEQRAATMYVELH